MCFLLFILCLADFSGQIQIHHSSSQSSDINTKGKTRKDDHENLIHNYLGLPSLTDLPGGVLPAVLATVPGY